MNVFLNFLNHIFKGNKEENIIAKPYNKDEMFKGRLVTNQDLVDASIEGDTEKYKDLMKTATAQFDKDNGIESVTVATEDPVEECPKCKDTIDHDKIEAILTDKDGSPYTQKNFSNVELTESEKEFIACVRWPAYAIDKIITPSFERGYKKVRREVPDYFDDFSDTILNTLEESCVYVKRGYTRKSKDTGRLYFYIELKDKSEVS